MSSLNWLQTERFEQARRIINDPAIRHILEEHRKAQYVIDRLGLRQLFEARRQLDELQRMRSALPLRIDRQLWQLIESTNLLRHQAFGEHRSWWATPAFGAIEDAITRRAHSATPDSLLFGVVDALPEIEKAAKDNDVDKLSALLLRLYDWLIEKLRNLAPGTLSYEGALNFRFSVVTFIISSVLTFQQMHEGTKTEERLTKLIRQQSDRLDETVKQLKPAQDYKTYFVVERSVTLKTSPFSKTVVIGKLYPNQKVSLVTEKGKWIEVEYFDYVDGALKRGWVMKKYLRRIR